MTEMKQQHIFPGILFIGVGCYFLLQQFSIPFDQQLLTWPSLLFVIGIAFLLQAYYGREFSMIFPGVLLTGLAIHFHSLALFSWWPAHWGMYTFIISIAFFLTYSKTRRGGLIPAILLLILSLLSFASVNPFQWLQETFSFIGELWPIFLIAIGIFLLLKK